MSKLLIIAGNLAALKSSIAKEISILLNVPCINKDDIKEILVDTIDFNTREENLKLSKASFQMIKYFAKKSLDRDMNLIIESNFKPHEIIELMAELPEKHNETKMLFLTGDSAKLYQRYVSRQDERHRAHTSTGLMSFSIFSKSMLSAKDFEFPDTIMEIDTTEFSVQDQNKLNQEMRRFFEIKE